jgi:hypothetical protein
VQNTCAGHVSPGVVRAFRASSVDEVRRLRNVCFGAMSMLRALELVGDAHGRALEGAWRP